MDRRRAAGALLALAVCIASSDAAPTASNQTALDLYDGATEGCYYNFQHYGEGDRIMTNEPCLNCTCHNRMLMCYLRVCPFTKPIGQDCTVEKRADQCCPVVTCPDVPVDLLTSTSTTSPAEYGATGVGKLDKYGCNINGKYFPEGSKVPPNPNNPCEHCYCIRNMTTCVMQECTLHVDGCTPIYNKDVCCPVRYSCDHPEDEMLLLDDMTTTVRPTPGFLLTTTTLSPVTQMSQDCVHEDNIVADGALIKTEKACEHCYCMKGDIVCVVQECGTPMENEGKNCTSLPPREGQCCPDTYICEGDESGTELPTGITTETSVSEDITTLSPPRRVGVEGSGYRKETEESYTEVTPFETDTEGSGYDHEIGPIIDTPDTDDKEMPEITSGTTEDVLYVTTTGKTPTLEEIERTTEPDKGLNTVPSGFEEESHETSVPQRTTISEEEHFTEPTIISEDKTNVPETITTSSDKEKLDKLSTTEPIVRKEDEDNEVTELTEHTVGEKLSTIQAQPTTQAEPQFETTLETETKAPSVDENEVKMTTTESYTTKYGSPVEKETTQSISEMTTAEVRTAEPATEVSPAETVKYAESTTTPSISEVSASEDTTKSDVSTDGDTIMQNEVTTESVSEITSSSSKPYAHEDVDTTKESVATTLSSVEFSSPAESMATSEESSEEMKEKESTTEASLEMSTQSKLAEPSDSTTLGTTKEEKEATTEPIVETSTAIGREGTQPSDEVSSESAMPGKEAITEPTLETSSHPVTTSVPDEMSTEQASKEKEVTTETSTLSSIPEKDSVPSKMTTMAEMGETDEILSTTERPSILETTSIDNKENEVDDSARIPGEGDCLLNSITYKNNSDVPSNNNCHTGCRCVSSIVKCDPIICSPPPEYMDNCQPIYDSPDSCCPTYICHPGETMPPQPDSHMAGTDKPVTSSIFECEGDKCIIKQHEESPAPSEKPADSGCGSASCGDETQGHAVVPDVEACVNGDCKEQPAQPDTQEHPHVPDTDKIPTEVCADGDCKGQPVQPDTQEQPHVPDTDKISTEVCADGDCKEQPAQPDTQEHPHIPDTDKIPTDVCADGDCKEQPAQPDTQEHPHIPDTDKIPTEVCADGDCKEQPAQPDTQEHPHVPDTDKIPTEVCAGDDCKEQPVRPDTQEHPHVPDSDKIPTEVCADGDCKEQPAQPDTQEHPHVPDIDKIPTEVCAGDDCKEQPVQPDTQEHPHVPDTDKIPTEVCADGDCKEEPVRPDTQEHPHVPDSDKIPTEVCADGDCKEQPAQPDTQEHPHVPDTDKIPTEVCAGGDCKEQPAQPDIQEHPHVPDTDKIPTEVCADGDCKEQPVQPDTHEHPHVPDTDKIPTEACADGECKEQAPEHTKPCDGDKCDIEPVIVPVKNIPLCENDSECKPQSVPCEGDNCVKVDCSTSDCDAGAESPTDEKEQKPETCTDKNNCEKPEDEVKLPCTDESCRRKETDELENQLPVDCRGAECEKLKPDMEGMDKIDVQTETPIKLPEPVTDTEQKESSPETPQPTEESPVDKFEQTPSSEDHSTTSVQTAEQSTTKPDYVDETSGLDTSTMGESLGTSEMTEAYLPTESPEENITQLDLTSHTIDIASSVSPAVTESQPLDKTPQTEEEIMKSTVGSEFTDQTTKLPEEQSSTKTPDELITVGIQTEKPVMGPETSEISTESQESSVTESGEPSTVTSLEVKTDRPDETKPEASTEGLSVTTISADKEYQTTESQDEGTKAHKDEKDTVTATPMLHTDQSTIEPEVSEGSTQSQEADKQQETQTSGYEPSDEPSSTLAEEIADVTTAKSPQRADSESTKVTEDATSAPEKTSEPESEKDKTTTVPKKDTMEETVQTTSPTELPSIVSTTQTQHEEETKEPFTNKPSVPYEDEKDSDKPTTEASIMTLKPEIESTEMQKESEPSDTSVTTSYETGTTSEEIPDKKQDDVETTVTKETTETETTKDVTSAAVTEPSSLTKQDDVTELPPAVPTLSSTLQASSTERQVEISKSPEPDQVTDIPVESTEKESVSETPEKSTIAVDEIASETPLSETTKPEIAVTESSPTEITKETTESRPASVSEESYPTDKTPEITDKEKEEEAALTEGPAMTQQQETFTSAQTEGDQTTPSSKLTPESASELDSHPTTSEYQPEKEVSTESSIQQMHTEPQEDDKGPIAEVTPSTTAELETSKEPIESATITESPEELITKEKETTASEKLFTTESPESHTKPEDGTTKLFSESEEISTAIPVIVPVTEQEEDTETTDISELGPKIKDEDSIEPERTTLPPQLTDAESESKQPDVTSFETSKDSTEPSITATNIPQSHVKDEEKDTESTTSSQLSSDKVEEQPTKAPHPTESELETEELLEVTTKPKQPTEIPQAITSQSVPESTEDVNEVLREGTTPSSSEETSQLYSEKSTEKADEMTTMVPQDIITEGPQMAITTKSEDSSLESHTETEAVKETSTEKGTEPAITDLMTNVESTTPKLHESVTEHTQEIGTKSVYETDEEKLETTRSPIELITTMKIEGEDGIPKDKEPSVTITPEIKATEEPGETSSDVQPSITTVVPEIKDTKYDTTSETNIILPEEKTTEHIPDTSTKLTESETSTELPDHKITKPEEKETSEPKYDITETTPYVVELEEHTHKAVEETSTMAEDLEEVKPTESIVEVSTEKEEPSLHDKEQITTGLPDENVPKVSEKDATKTTPTMDELTTQSIITSESPVEKEDEVSPVPTQPHEDVSSIPEQETEIPSQTEKAPSTDLSHETMIPEQEIIPITSKATTTTAEESTTTSAPIPIPEAKPAEPLPVPETPKPGINEVLPTEEIPEDDGHFPPSGGTSGYGQEPDYVEEDQAFGPGTCRYGGKVYVSAQQIPRDDPCDFCFCFRSDIICLQQSCPPPIHGCHEEPIQGFCCPRYECPVAMATSVNVTTTTTTTTTTLPPHFLPHAYKGAAQRRGCQIKGHTYKVGEVVRSSSGPCLHCTCGGDGQMKCDPKACTPEPMLRQMIAAAVSAKRRR